MRIMMYVKHGLHCQPPLSHISHLINLQATHSRSHTPTACTVAFSYSLTPRQRVACCFVLLHECVCVCVCVCVCACIGRGCCHEEIAAPPGVVSDLVVLKELLSHVQTERKLPAVLRLHEQSQLLITLPSFTRRRDAERRPPVDAPNVVVCHGSHSSWSFASPLISTPLCSACEVTRLSVTKFRRWNYKATPPLQLSLLRLILLLLLLHLWLPLCSSPLWLLLSSIFMCTSERHTRC